MLGSFSFQRTISVDWVSTDFSSPQTLLKEIPCRDLKFSSQPTDALKFVMSNFSANSSAFAVNVGPDIGMFLSLADLNHFRVAVSTSLNVEVYVFFLFGLNC